MCDTASVGVSASSSTCWGGGGGTAEQPALVRVSFFQVARHQDVTHAAIGSLNVCQIFLAREGTRVRLAGPGKQ
jgi:hypothetical protein